MCAHQDLLQNEGTMTRPAANMRGQQNGKQNDVNPAAGGDLAFAAKCITKSLQLQAA
jgi:hypothetical protein